VGNDAQLNPSVYPAGFTSAVMGIASTSDLDTQSSFTNYGNAIVFVAAPGEAIITTYPFASYAAGWGTSFSAPFVSGGASLLVNKQPNIIHSAAATAIAHADVVGPNLGNGRLNLVLALGSLTQPTSSSDFAISATPSTLSITAGQSASYSASVTPVGGFKGIVTLTCGGAPALTTCSISPTQVTLDGINPAIASITLTNHRAFFIPTRRATAICAPATSGEIPRKVPRLSFRLRNALETRSYSTQAHSPDRRRCPAARATVHFVRR